MKGTLVLKKEHKGNKLTVLEKLKKTIFMFPEKEFTLTELSETAKVPKSGVSRVLPTLLQDELVLNDKHPILYKIIANTSCQEYKKQKIAFNFSQICSTKLVEFLEDYFHHPKSIVLFGSYRHGNDNSKSDIDIAIEILEKKDIESISIKDLNKFEEILGRKIQIHLFNRGKIDSNLWQSIANGIVLSGVIEV